MNKLIKKLLVTGAGLLILTGVSSSINGHSIHASYLSHMHQVVNRTIRIERHRGGEIENYEYGLGTGNYHTRKELLHNMIRRNGYRRTYRILKHWFGNGSASYLLNIHRKNNKRIYHKKYYKHYYRTHRNKRSNRKAKINNKWYNFGFNASNQYNHDDLVGVSEKRMNKDRRPYNKYRTNKYFKQGWDKATELAE